MTPPVIAISGAGGRLGTLVIQMLLGRVPASSLVAIVREPAKAQPLQALGVQLRVVPANDAAALASALTGVDRLLLVPDQDLKVAAARNLNCIAVAQALGLSLVVYLSLLRADTTEIDPDRAHLQTEQALEASGLPFLILRCGWFHEHYTASVKPAIVHGGLVGSAGQGRISSAARADYAEAAVLALCGRIEPGRRHELAGDQSYTLSEFAAEVSWQTGLTIPYINLPEADYVQTLLHARIPRDLAHAIAHWDSAASRGALHDESHELSRLLGRPTMPVSSAISAVLGRPVSRR